jgi:predicted MFS family arabinose efflux permease
VTDIIGPSKSSWAAVISVAIGTFALVTTEFLPVGLLSHIAVDFNIPAGQAGILVTTPGIVAAIAAPLCTVAAKGMDRKLLLVGFTFLLLVSNVIMATAQTLEVAIVGRALLGVSVGGFWTFAAAVGRKLVAEESGARATSIIMAGISVGTVVGVPLGAALGSMIDWRFAFSAVAILCFAIMLAQAAFLPKITLVTAQTFTGLLKAAQNPKLALAFAAAAIASAGHFTAYTYFEPHLVEEAGATPSTVGWLLAIYGVAGVFGTFLGERLGARRPETGFLFVAVAMSASIFMTFAWASNLPAEAGAIALWGAAFGAVPVCVQLWTYASDPQRFETSSALMVTVFQFALAGGSFAGGILADRFGLSAAFVGGSILSLICALFICTTLIGSAGNKTKET